MDTFIINKIMVYNRSIEADLIFSLIRYMENTYSKERIEENGFANIYFSMIKFLKSIKIYKKTFKI